MISSDVLKQIQLVKITTRRVVDNLFAGDYYSIHKGRGTDFLEIREYDPQEDDVREIDWKVTSRFGTTFVRKFREERDLMVYMLVDLSGSMGYGSGGKNKFDRVIEICALIGMSVIKRNMRLGLIGFSDKVQVFSRPKCGRKHLYNVLERLCEMKPDNGKTDINAALRFLNNVARKGSMVFLISDFMSKDYFTLLKAARIRYDLIPVHVKDPVEEEMPKVGLVEFMDPETGKRRVLDTSDPSFQKNFRKTAIHLKKERETLLRSLGMDRIHVSTEKSVVRPVKELFYRRVNQRGGRPRG